MAQVRCPTCRQLFDTETTAAMPFCSNRCRQIDLGRWLKEEYSVPSESEAEDSSDLEWEDEED